MLEDLGSLAGTRVNGERVAQFGPLQPDDEIQAGPCLLRVRDCAPPGATAPARLAGAGEQGRPPGLPARDEYSGENGQPADVGLASAQGAGGAVGIAAAPGAAAGEHGGPEGDVGTGAAWRPQPAMPAGAQALVPTPERLALQRRLHAALLEALDLRRRDVASMSDGALRSEAEARLGELI